MSEKAPSAPALGDSVAAARASHETLELLAARRSTLAKLLGEPGPSEGELEIILQIAGRVPDHRRLEPWRLVVIEGAARQELHARLSAIYAETQRSGSPKESEKALEKLAAVVNAPVTICVVSAIRADSEKARKTPEWEQQLSVGAVCQNLLLAANASGYAAQWVTEWYAYEPRVWQALDLNAGERIAGFIFVGTARQDPLERKRPEPAAYVRRWRGDGSGR